MLTGGRGYACGRHKDAILPNKWLAIELTPSPLDQYLIEILPDLGPEFVNSIAEFLGQLLPNLLQVFQVPILSRNKSNDKRP